jgi:hypothetical protein
MIKEAYDTVADSIADVDDDSARQALAWTSIAIGVTEVAAPLQLQRLMGVYGEHTTAVLRTMGVREILHGVDLLSHDDPKPAVWRRVVGDVIDGALLAVAAPKSRRPGGFVAICAAVLPVVLADVLFAGRLSTRKKYRDWLD